MPSRRHSPILKATVRPSSNCTPSSRTQTSPSESCCTILVVAKLTCEHLVSKQAQFMLFWNQGRLYCELCCVCRSRAALDVAGHLLGSADFVQKISGVTEAHLYPCSPGLTADPTADTSSLHMLQKASRRRQYRLCFCCWRKYGQRCALSTQESAADAELYSC